MTSASCGLCGHQGQLIALSLRVRHGLARVNPWFDANPKTYELCPACGAKRELESRLAA